MESEVKVSCTTSIQAPVELVELPVLRDQSGEPVRVMCCRVRRHHIARVAKRLPGEHPRLGVSEPTEVSEDEEDRRFEHFLALASELISRGTYLLAPDGREVRPAFWFDERVPRDPDSLPGGYLVEEDLAALTNAILRLSGFSGGAASEETFPARDGGGPAAGGGALDVLPGGGSDAVGSDG
jgi:hypothetical protein